jgi:hypothetical protein
MAVERFPVEAGHIMLFARAIGEDDPAYYGAMTGSGDVPAPPTFVQASAQFDPDYFLRPKIGEKWFGSGRTDSGTAGASGGAGEDSATESSASEDTGKAVGSGLHAEQHFTYHRPLRAGAVLTAKTRAGETWEKQGRRGGKLMFGESITDYFDEKGELVVTARSVGVRTERVVEQEA